MASSAPIRILNLYPMKKLTRKQVAEGLQSVPLDVVLLGAAGAKQSKLTPKQRKFAEGIAMGKTGAQSYRDSYNTQTAPIHAGHQAHRLKKDPKIAAQIDALTLAAEARKYATPAALRSLVIERLTAHAIDDDINPAQRLRALELLGKVTEIAAFTERREIVRTEKAGDARAALLEILRTALRHNVTDAEPRSARISGNVIDMADAVASQDIDPGTVAEGQDATPTGAHPPEPAEGSAHPLLSNPHTEFHENSNQSPEENLRPAPALTPHEE